MFKNIILLVVVLAFAKVNSQNNPHTALPETVALATRMHQDHVDQCRSKSRLLDLTSHSNNSATTQYDMKYVRLELEVDPDSPIISGVVTHHFQAVTDLDQILLDLAFNINVSAVTQRGAPLNFSHNSNDQLWIDLPMTQVANQLDSIHISYSGNPISSGFGSFEQTTHQGAGVVWTLSEPYGAKAWWPTKQDLNDKIDRTEVILNVPDGNTAVSNGLMTSETVIATGKRFRWVHEYPIPAYLIAFAATNYVKYTDVVSNRTFPLNIDNYVYPENLASAQASTAVTVPIMEFFEVEFGTYPFSNEKYGHAQFGWGGGMEHTTISFMGNFSRNLIAHELAHQWFGNKVTCGSWQDIWLNESFATFATGRTIEELDGDAAYENWRISVNNVVTNASAGSVYVPAQDTLSVSRVFNSRLSYNKGAMVLHMLRKKLGDVTFKSVLQTYLNDPALSYNYAVTADFKAVVQQVSGVNLDEFFNDWIYGQGHPQHEVVWSNDANGMVNVEIFQSQSHTSVSFFEVDLPLRFIGTAGEILEVTASTTSDGQQFVFSPGFVVTEVQIDPFTHTLSRNNSSVLSVSDAFAKAELHIFPNPTSGYFHIKSGTVNILGYEVYDLSGRRIAQQNTTAATDLIECIQLPTTKAMYIVKVHTVSGDLYRRLMVR
jgi:aminopeptidase N